jgi:hypothetical protein
LPPRLLPPVRGTVRGPVGGVRAPRVRPLLVGGLRGVHQGRSWAPGVPTLGLVVALSLHLGPIPWDRPRGSQPLPRVLPTPGLCSGGAATGCCCCCCWFGCCCCCRVGAAPDHSDAPEVFSWGVLALVPPDGTIRLGIAPSVGFLRGAFPRLDQVFPDLAGGAVPGGPRDPRGRFATPPRHLVGAAAAAAGGLLLLQGWWCCCCCCGWAAAAAGLIVPEGRGFRSRREREGRPKEVLHPQGARRKRKKRAAGGARAAEDRASTSTGPTHKHTTRKGGGWDRGPATLEGRATPGGERRQARPAPHEQKDLEAAPGGGDPGEAGSGGTTAVGARGRRRTTTHPPGAFSFFTLLSLPSLSSGPASTGPGRSDLGSHYGAVRRSGSRTRPPR